MQPGSWRRPDATSTQRGYGYRWQQARAGYLAKHPFCVFCLRDLGIHYSLNQVIDQAEQAEANAAVMLKCNAMNAPIPFANVVDHEVPHRGDQRLMWDRNNWQPLCTTHHSGEKQIAEAKG